MPRLRRIVLSKCRLRNVPPGFASNASSLEILFLDHVKQLSYIESFPSVVELTVNGCPDPNICSSTIFEGTYNQTYAHALS